MQFVLHRNTVVKTYKMIALFTAGRMFVSSVETVHCCACKVVCFVYSKSWHSIVGRSSRYMVKLTTTVSILVKLREDVDSFRRISCSPRLSISYLHSPEFQNVFLFVGRTADELLPIVCPHKTAFYSVREIVLNCCAFDDGTYSWSEIFRRSGFL